MLVGYLVINFLKNMNMKKSLLVVALLGAFVGAFDVATAQSNVTVYGTVDAGVAYDNGASKGGKKLSLESGQQSYSRVGFKGTEDLGRGLKALFLVEQGVQIDTGKSGYSTLGSNVSDLGNSGIFSSQAYIGLSSDLGAIKLGRQFSPLYEAHGEIDPFSNGFASNINNFFGADQVNFADYQRMSNAVIYNTADLQGFKGALAYGFGEVAGSVPAQSQVGVSLRYANGPVTVVYAYHHANNAQTLGPSNEAFSTHFIGAKYHFGLATLHAAFDQNKLGNSFKTQDYMVGVTVPFGANSIFANYTHKKDNVLSDANADQFGIGYTYSLSTRTNVYTSYNYVKNNTKSSINTDFAGRSVNTFQLGMRHMF